MEKREDVLREALGQNQSETTRWESYRDENKIAIENLHMFSKHLTVDVMVPLGRKAFIPGQLVHTNEVLVGHFQGYFSKCSAYKAMEICDRRLQMAEEQLKKLQIEADLWQNKLEKPYLEGVLPNVEEREIIEEYDEEQEKLWKEKHKLRVKQAKWHEREEREKQATMEQKAQQVVEEEKNDNEDVLKMLEEAELMEELEKELNNLQMDEINDETIRKLMAGEIKLPNEKSRNAHHKKEKSEPEMKAETLHGVIKKTDIDSLNIPKVPATNNNNTPNPDLHESYLDNDDDENDYIESDTELTEEAQDIIKQVKCLSYDEKIVFYEKHIQIINQKISQLPLTNDGEINQKIHLLTVLENLEDLLEYAEDKSIAAEEEFRSHYVDDANEQASTDIKENSTQKKKKEKMHKKKIAFAFENPTRSKQKKNISFALEDQTVVFHDNEAVTQIMPSKRVQRCPPKRDIITLDEPLITVAPRMTPTAPLKQKLSILEKVENNLKFVEEHQSKQDFDLVNKILTDSMGKAQTLHITFQHSTQTPYENGQFDANTKEDSAIPQAPSDFYELYLKERKTANSENTAEQPITIFINSFEGEDQVHTPILREEKREHAYVDPRMEFFSARANEPVDNKITESSKIKSILRNCGAVVQEKHMVKRNAIARAKNKVKEKTPPANEMEYMSAYYKVMNDVVEKTISEPEPLPACKYIDAHTPKKRVSRFKQMRAGNTNTEKT